MRIITVTTLVLFMVLTASVASAQEHGTICGGLFTAGGGTLTAESGHQLSSAIGEPIAGAPEATPEAPGFVSTGYLYRECSGSIVVAAPPAESAPPLRTALAQSYPNPFNPRTTITFRLAKEGPMTLGLFDSAGRRVRDLLDQSLPAGEHTHVLEASGLASGVYYLRLDAQGESHVRSVVLLK